MLQCHEILARLERVEHGFLLLELFLGVVGRLDREANAAVRPVDLDHTGRHLLTHVQDILDFLDSLLANLADVHQAIDVVLQSDERAKAGELRNLPLDQVTDLVQIINLVPRILGKLLDADGDALVFLVHLEHLRLDFQALFQNLGRVVDLAGPGDVGDVDHGV